MAQLVEQRIRNAQVVGSSPTTSSKKASRKTCFFAFMSAEHIFIFLPFVIIQIMLFLFPLFHKFSYQ